MTTLDELGKDEKKYIYPCPICGRKFKHWLDLDTHVQRNLWRIGYDEIDGIDHLKCKHCGKEFVTDELALNIRPALVQFKSHMPTRCGSEAYRKYRFAIPPQKKGKWTAHPIHKKLVAKHIKHDKEKYVLRQHRNVTYLLIESLEFGFEDAAWNVVQIVGPTGHGKSAAGIFLGQWMCDYVEDYPDMFEDFTGRPKLHITHSLFETTEKFRIAKPHDTILQDESPNLQGRGSNWFAASLATLMDTMRAAKVNLIFCTPDVLEELKTHQFIVEVYARWKTAKQTWCYLFDPERTALGECFLDVSTTLKSEEYKEYGKKKMANIAALKRSGGSLSPQVSEERRREDVDRVVREVLASDMIPEDKLPKISLERVMGMTTYLVDGIEAYQKEVAYYAQHMVHQQFQPSPEEEIKAKGALFEVESECKQLLESEFYKSVVERECNSKATIRYASELFDWEKYRGDLFENKSDWERVCKVIVDVVVEKRINEIDAEQATRKPLSETGYRTDDIEVGDEWLGHTITEPEQNETINDLPVLETIYKKMKPLTEQHAKAVCWFLHRYVKGMHLESGATATNEYYNTRYNANVTHPYQSYTDTFMPALLGQRKGGGKINIIGEGTEKTINELLYDDTLVHFGGPEEPDLARIDEEGNIIMGPEGLIVECKYRSMIKAGTILDAKHKPRDLILQNPYLKKYRRAGTPVHGVVIGGGTGKWIIRRCKTVDDEN